LWKARENTFSGISRFIFLSHCGEEYQVRKIRCVTNMCKTLVGKSEGKRQLGGEFCSLEDNNKLSVKGISVEAMSWI
jgi:hypothetical protein